MEEVGVVVAPNWLKAHPRFRLISSALCSCQRLGFSEDLRAKPLTYLPTVRGSESLQTFYFYYNIVVLADVSTSNKKSLRIDNFCPFNSSLKQNFPSSLVSSEFSLSQY